MVYSVILEVNLIPLLLLNKENKKKDIIQLIKNFKKIFKKIFFLKFKE